jgi:predicted nucleic acid-binding protein
MIEIGNIVTLENQKDFLLLEEVSVEGRRFVYAVRVLEDETPTNEYVIYEAINAEDGEYLKDVTNKDEYDRLVEEFKNVISNKIISGDYDDMVQQGETA